MSRTALAVLSIALLSACASSQKNAAATPAVAKPTAFFNITSGTDDPHAVTMALQLAGHALADGRQVVLFFNVKGVQIPLKTLDPGLSFKDKPIKTLLADLIRRRAEVHVCPHCIKAMGVEAGALVAGARVTTRAALFSRLTASTNVFSY